MFIIRLGWGQMILGPLNPGKDLHPVRVFDNIFQSLDGLLTFIVNSTKRVQSQMLFLRHSFKLHHGLPTYRRQL